MTSRLSWTWEIIMNNDTDQYRLKYTNIQFQTDFDNNNYLLASPVSKEWGLKSTYQQWCTFKSISGAIKTILKFFSSWRAEMIQKQLRIEFGIWAPRWVYCVLAKSCLIFLFLFISMHKPHQHILEDNWVRCCQGPLPLAIQAWHSKSHSNKTLWILRYVYYNLQYLHWSTSANIFYCRYQSQWSLIILKSNAFLLTTMFLN